MPDGWKYICLKEAGSIKIKNQKHERLDFTLEQLKEAAHKHKTVYYSTGCLWWTHDPEDLKKSTEMGKKAAAISHQRFMNDPNQPEEKKQRMHSLLEGLKEHEEKYGSHTPLDPWGAPLMMMDLNKWVKAAEEKPGHFGNYKLEAFMKAHHKNHVAKYANCEGDDLPSPFIKWEHVTDYLDGYYGMAKLLNVK